MPRAFGHRHAHRRVPCEDKKAETRDRDDASVHPGMPKMASKTPEARGEADADSFSQLSEGANPADTSDIQPPAL